MLSDLHSTVILFIILCFLHMPISLGQDDERYRSCGEPFRCGSMDIVYPFWGARKPEYCGHPSFEISCESNIPKITIESTRYTVMSINTPSRILTLARDDLLSSICLDNPANASFDLNTFSYVSSDLNITLYFGCTVRPGLQLPSSSPNTFICNRNSNIFGIYTLIDVPFDLSLVTCQEEIIARVNQTSAEALASPTASGEVLRRAIAGGFSVNWTAGIDSKCQQCDSSDGRCGSNPDSGDFACHCVNGAHSNDCNDGQRAVPIAAGCIAGLAIISVPIIYCLRRRGSSCKPLICWKIESRDHKIEEFMRNYGSHAPRLYSYSDLKKITSSFSHKIGKGGFGQVYKGKLPDGRAVAVKVLKETNGDGEEYINEVASIS
ncbi:hypothetical protein RDI58_005887 [Solanum bulbocastanum]|uniref:non-specific serine/threonine protein kinase n=1 Tax=Solanum bulbocastanum TaxID=147425 RepID=A0AAN8U1H1_SOLBU